MTKNVWTVCAILLLLTGCNYMKLTLDPRVEAAVNETFAEVCKSKGTSFGSHFPDNPDWVDTEKQLDALRNVIPKEAPRHTKLVSWTIFLSSNAGKFVTVDEEYDYGNRIAMVETVLQWPTGDYDDDWSIYGFHFNISPINRLPPQNFSVTHKSLSEYAFLSLVILSPLVVFFAIIRVIRHRSLKRKWLWCLACLFGVFNWTMDWTNGRVIFHWLTIQFISLGIVKRGASHFSPWFVETTLPIGALIVLAGIYAWPLMHVENKVMRPNE